MPIARKECVHCHETKPVTEFRKHPETRDGLQSWCASCQDERVRKWREDNPGKERDRVARKRMLIRVKAQGGLERDQ